MVTKEEILRLIDKNFKDTFTSTDNLLAAIALLNLELKVITDNLNINVDNTNFLLENTNLKLDSLVSLSGGTSSEVKNILPGDVGVSLAIGSIDNIISCVINGITINAIAKTYIAKYEAIVVVPGGNPDEPYVVSTAIKIKGDSEGVPVNISVNDDGFIEINVTDELNRVITLDSFAVNSGNLTANGSAKEFDITGFVNTAKIVQVIITQLTAGVANYTFEIWEKDSSGYDPSTRSDLYLKVYSRDFTISEDSDIIEPYILYTDRDETEELHCRIVNNAGGTDSDFDVSVKTFGHPL